MRAEERGAGHTSFVTISQRLEEVGESLPPHSCSGPRRQSIGFGKKAVPALHPSPVSLLNNLLGSRLRRWLSWENSHLHVVQALGLFSDFSVPLQDRWGICLIAGLLTHP